MHIVHDTVQIGLHGPNQCLQVEIRRTRQQALESCAANQTQDRGMQAL